ncbi:G-type lectin S-receptor-like serine/threonine-protein kinase SD2-5 isoform X2 [Beta vulgaris subsp. vulgaris]|uniref:G-type lectin S-receptor-like serine/threonine-protein kinase SD2-5 isoform X2 n=1 Tax=Beta vulgaris subsp. vulgaris TaxID=3555 RepID=UPI00203698A8|nr:G-type lectin S-receptor-like serine/threonine-protein kinase SD2-5 isoform X2 [Beta vulgaris subsp. vulgaris]XP_057250493.1 G-type lectin S-receptor-like serine/threonine-protein kinase SD2-5 isoform X2 [Beta vulgaris subsp. vulgaris]XP_057250494.1 G-type lectin S-receptor-like serine/threonine-protein kinase SD2-5 isoform X2 [Beta vulgaris subsp. vulgaris]
MAKDRVDCRVPALYSQQHDDYPPFGFGFFANQTANSFILAIYMGSLDDENSSPVVVWCANRDHPVGDGATLNLTSEGDLVLRDADGSFVWSTNTSGHSVKSIELKENGNLVLLNGNGKTIWESFEYPTDTLLYGQALPKGRRLTSSISTSNYSSGIFYVLQESDGYMHAFVELDPPQEYGDFLGIQRASLEFPYSLNDTIPYSSSYAYLHLYQNGHLNQLLWNFSEYNPFSLLDDHIYGDCEYPTMCGTYGVCMDKNKCRCPRGSDDSLNYFKLNDEDDPNSGCNPITPLSCPDTKKLHGFLELDNVTYFDSTPSHVHTDVESCKRACLNQCSCKAVFFHYYNDTTLGNCTLPSEVLTLMDVSSDYSLGYKAVAFIKVQNRMQNRTASWKRNVVLSIFATLIFLALVIGILVYLLMKRRRISAKGTDSSFGILVDTVSRFSFESLKLATEDFQTMLGRGGFGSVFEGTLIDGTKVAVKRLDSSGQGRKEFLAEVNTIGNFHHFNLVRLIGFCDDGLNRLLVYEFMCNGSLEKWIFNQDIAQTLTWHLRRRIIDGVASGLEYLHEHCNQNVIHFDIKPQNILLDRDFNIKIADFGLAKMVDRDQSQVMTIVRGTPGYMAPELINGRAISVKVDVYSFGVLVLEIVCGRKNFGSLEGDCLTNLVKAKADADQLSDLIDERAEDMKQQQEEVVKIMKIAIWCLQPHFIRPTMSMVVKVLQDLSNLEQALSDLSYLTMVQEATPVEDNYNFSVRPTESLLSGPR